MIVSCFPSPSRSSHAYRCTLDTKIFIISVPELGKESMGRNFIILTVNNVFFDL